MDFFFFKKKKSFDVICYKKLYFSHLGVLVVDVSFRRVLFSLQRCCLDAF